MFYVTDETIEMESNILKKLKHLRVFCEFLRRERRWFSILGNFWLSNASTLYATAKPGSYVSF